MVKTGGAVNTGLTNAYVTSLAVNGATIFAGTWGGVFRSTDNGQNWGVGNTGLTNSYITSLAISGTTIFAGTWGGGVFRSTDNGQNWGVGNTGLISWSVNKLAVNGATIYAGTETGVFLSTNNGNNWINSSGGLPSYSKVYSIDFDNTYAYIGTNRIGVWKRPLAELTGIEEINNKNNILVYPNPADDDFTIEVSEKSEILISNTTGKCLKSFIVNGGKINIDISDFPKGIYFIKAQNTKNNSTQKLIKL